MCYKIIFCRKEKHRDLFTDHSAFIKIYPLSFCVFYLQKLFPIDIEEQLLVFNFAKPSCFLLPRGL